VPGFAAWLTRTEALTGGLRGPRLRTAQAALDGLRHRHGRDLAGLVPPGPGAAAGATAAASGAGARRGPADDEADRQALSRLCAFYLAHVSASDSPLADPVARFHLNNGARLQRINPAADLSRKGLKQSFGLMVNYRYDLEQIEANHDRFTHGEVSASRAVLAMI
jgi:malonyl-CoA decarboxylase